jgi:hypothetical protein
MTRNIGMAKTIAEPIFLEASFKSFRIMDFKGLVKDIDTSRIVIGLEVEIPPAIKDLSACPIFLYEINPNSEYIAEATIAVITVASWRDPPYIAADTVKPYENGNKRAKKVNVSGAMPVDAVVINSKI